MNNLKIVYLILLLFLGCQTLKAQSKIKSYSFKKGQVFDIIFLTNKSDVDNELKIYFEKVFPVAQNIGYSGLNGFRVEDNIQGNYQPQTMILGYWKAFDNREEFLKKIMEEVPEFHEMRRKIWSTFDLTYYELKDDLSFEIDRDKYNVVTAYWKKDKKSIQKFKKEFANMSKEMGGVAKLELVDGKSPFGYYYNPDYLVITEWKSKEAFELFKAENLKMDHSTIQHVNQLHIN